MKWLEDKEGEKVRETTEVEKFELRPFLLFLSLPYNLTLQY